jgi:endonuclease YncB( thermonuclease family)
MRLRSLGFQLIAVSFLADPAGAATVVAVGDGATLRVRDEGRLLTILLVCIVAPEIFQRPHEAIAREALQRLAPVGSEVVF